MVFTLSSSIRRGDNSLIQTKQITAILHWIYPAKTKLHSAVSKLIKSWFIHTLSQTANVINFWITNLYYSENIPGRSSAAFNYSANQNAKISNDQVLVKKVDTVTPWLITSQKPLLHLIKTASCHFPFSLIFWISFSLKVTEKQFV